MWLLADKVVELNYIDSISQETIYQVLKKTKLNLGAKKGWVIPSGQNGNFVAHMEMVLDVYKRSFDPKYTVVCMNHQKLNCGNKNSHCGLT